MNSITGAQKPLTASPASTAPMSLTALTSFKARFEPLRQQPWLLCAMVLMVALMSTYVHVVNGQVERGERFRAGLAEAAKKPRGGQAQLLADASEQSLSPVAMDTGR